MVNSSTQPEPLLSLYARNVDVDSVIVEGRYRHDMGDLHALAESILAEGLLQPIGVTHTRRLVFGERRLRAVRDILKLTTIDCRVVDVSSIVAGEYAENEVRKDFTPSERVAIAEAVRADLDRKHGERRGRPAGNVGPLSHFSDMEDDVEAEPAENTDDGPCFSEATSDALPAPRGETRNLAAQRAGFGSGKQFERASNVVRLGTPPLVAAMDRGEVSISAAAEIAKAAPAEQAAIVALPEPERIEAVRQRRAEATRLRAAAAEQVERTGPTAYTGFLKKNGRLPDADEAKTIATLDHRETPAEGGKRVKPATAPTSKEERARKKILDGYQDEGFRLQQALQLLTLNKTDPALMIEHILYVDKDVIDQNLRAARAYLNRFAREYRRHGK